VIHLHRNLCWMCSQMTQLQAGEDPASQYQVCGILVIRSTT